MPMVVESVLRSITPKAIGFCMVLLVALSCGCVRCEDSDQPDSSADSIQVTGIEHKSIQLPCSLPPPTPPRSVVNSAPRVRWFDFVYNSDPNPTQIFDSWNNSELVVSPHPNNKSYEINANFTLTIHNLKISEDPGEYFCEILSNDGRTLMQSYYLTVGGIPECSGGNPHGMNVGETTKLECESKYSGNKQPKLTWYRGELEIPSEDAFDIRLAKQTVDLMVSHIDNDVQYTCVMEFGDIVDECPLKLHVWYPVRDVILQPPNRTQFFVGDQVTCSARGNPAPRLTVEPVKSSRLLSNGSRVIEVDGSWKGRDVTLNCSATNTVGAVRHQMHTSLVISVSERPMTVQATTKSTPLPPSKIVDNNPGIVGGAIVIVALILLLIIGAVVLVRKHREKQRQKAAAAAKAASQSRQ